MLEASGARGRLTSKSGRDESRRAKTAPCPQKRNEDCDDDDCADDDDDD